MKNINTLKRHLSLLAIIAVFLLACFIPSSVLAGPQDSEGECVAAGGQWGVVSPEVTPPLYGCTGLNAEDENATGGLQPINNSAECEVDSSKCCNGVALTIGADCPGGDDINPILAYLAGVINFLALGVPIVVVAAIIVGGIQYITAGGVPQKLESARKRITNAIIALVTFMFLYAILRWLVPGDVF